MSAPETSLGQRGLASGIAENDFSERVEGHAD